MSVFVYGTLTDPQRVETVLGGVAQYDLECEATLEGLHRVEGEYPTLAPGGRVEGRLLAVDERGLDALDRYEGVDRELYVRVAVPSPERDEPVQVYVGDPIRLDVDGVSWPDGTSLADRVRTYIDRQNIMLRCDE